MMWLGAGGLAYTLGIIFFALDRPALPFTPRRTVVLAGQHSALLRLLFLCGSGAAEVTGFCCITPKGLKQTPYMRTAMMEAKRGNTSAICAAWAANLPRFDRIS